MHTVSTQSLPVLFISLKHIEELMQAFDFQMINAWI